MAGVSAGLGNQCAVVSSFPSLPALGMWSTRGAAGVVFVSWGVALLYSCFTGVVDRGSWLSIAQQYFSCALVWGCGIVSRHHYQSTGKSAEKDFRVGDVVPFE